MNGSAVIIIDSLVSGGAGGVSGANRSDDYDTFGFLSELTLSSLRMRAVTSSPVSILIVVVVSGIPLTFFQISFLHPSGDPVRQLESFILQQCGLASPPAVDPVKWGKPEKVVIKDVDDPAGCRVLCNVNARRAIDAYQRSLPILLVPLEKRSAAEHVFLSSIPKHMKAGGQLSFDYDERRPLLCNSGARGAGKSVLQAFNMLWFVQQLGGVPIEITFNDDQALFGVDFRDTAEFQREVAVRLFDRVIAFHKGVSPSQLDFVTPLRPLLGAFKEPFAASLPIARTVLGAPPDCPVFLAVDELSKINQFLTKRLDGLDKGFLHPVHLNIDCGQDPDPAHVCHCVRLR